MCTASLQICTKSAIIMRVLTLEKPNTRQDQCWKNNTNRREHKKQWDILIVEAVQMSDVRGSLANRSHSSRVNCFAS